MFPLTAILDNFMLLWRYLFGGDRNGKKDHEAGSCGRVGLKSTVLFEINKLFDTNCAIKSPPNSNLPVHL